MMAVILIWMLINISAIVVIVALVVFIRVIRLIMAILMMAITIIIMTSVWMPRHYCIFEGQIIGAVEEVSMCQAVINNGCLDNMLTFVTRDRRNTE